MYDGNVDFCLGDRGTVFLLNWAAAWIKIIYVRHAPARPIAHPTATLPPFTFLSRARHERYSWTR